MLNLQAHGKGYSFQLQSEVSLGNSALVLDGGGGMAGGRFRLFAPDASFTPHASPLLCAATRAHISMPALPTRVSQHCGGAHQAEVVPGDGVHPLADFFVLVVDELLLLQVLQDRGLHLHQRVVGLLLVRTCELPPSLCSSQLHRNAKGYRPAAKQISASAP